MEHSDKCKAAAKQFNITNGLSRDAALTELRSNLESILVSIQQEQSKRLHDECEALGLGSRNYAGNGGGL